MVNVSGWELSGSGAFLGAAVWDGQWGGYISFGGWPRIPDDIVYDWVNGILWHHLCDSTLWICNLAILNHLQPILQGAAGEGGAELWQGRLWHDHREQTCVFCAVWGNIPQWAALSHPYTQQSGHYNEWAAEFGNTSYETVWLLLLMFFCWLHSTLCLRQNGPTLQRYSSKL